MKNTLRERIMLEELKSVCYVGEDGDMAVACKTRRGAWIKFRQQMREDCDEDTAQDLEIDFVGPAYAHLLTPKEQKESEYGAEWAVGKRKIGVNNFKVWLYSC